jgi:hypothetical protein
MATVPATQQTGEQWKHQHGDEERKSNRSNNVDKSQRYFDEDSR